MERIGSPRTEEGGESTSTALLLRTEPGRRPMRTCRDTAGQDVKGVGV